MSPEGLAENAEEWIEVPDGFRIDGNMFVAQVVGRSMEPEIPDGSLCVFRYNPAGSRRNRKVLVENYGDASQRYTVKRYQSEKEYSEDGGFRHKRIILEPLNPEFEPWELEEGSECRILGEFLRVLD
jgi:SOS-response transcriptional repressor LexA